MSKTTKIWLIVGASLLVVGLIMFASVMFAVGWNFRDLSTEKYEMNTYETENKFENILINTDTADIIFSVSADGKSKVVCNELKNAKHSVEVKNNTLEIQVTDEREWFDYVGIMSGAPEITVYLPKTEYNSLVIDEDTGDIEIPNDFQFGSVDISTDTGDVKTFAFASDFIKIKTSTGSIAVENVNTNTLDLTVSTGKVTVNDVTCDSDVKITVSTGKAFLSDIECKNFESVGSTGDIKLRKVTASQNFKITRSTGDVEFDHCDADEVYIKTGTGDIEGDFLTEKTFVVTTNTGDVEVPRTTNGGRCEIITSTGDIEIEIGR